MTNHKSIVDGPGKFDMMVALFDRPKNNRNDHALCFTLEGGRPMALVIRGILMEDGSHESWIVTGYEMSTGRRFEAYYETRRRTGHVTYV